MPDKAGPVEAPGRYGGLVWKIARLRVPLGFAAGTLVLWLSRPSVVTLVAGGIVAAGGEALRIWAAGHLNKGRDVTQSGPYRWMAHPLYAGSSVMGAGMAIASRSLTCALLIAVYLGVTLTAAIRKEEAALRGAFGERYDRYLTGHERSAPRGPAEHGPARSFSLRLAVANREHRAVAGLAIVFVLLLLKATYGGGGTGRG